MQPKTTALKNPQNAPEFYWCWKANKNPFDDASQPEWEPYSNEVNQVIEENFLKKIPIFEIELGNQTYCINFNRRLQYLKTDSNRCRPIYRAKRKDIFQVIKTQGAEYLIENFTYNENENLAKKVQEKEEGKIQKRIKVCELFGDPKKDKGFIFNETIANANAKEKELFNIFNTEIRISSQIYEELRNKFYQKVAFNDVQELITYIENEIKMEAQSFSLMNTNNKHEYPQSAVNLASHYVEILKKSLNSHKCLQEIFVSLFLLEDGFLQRCLNSVLKNSSTLLNSHLNLFFVLLQASIKLISEKSNSKYASKAIKTTIEGINYYVFYRNGKISKKTLENNIELLNNSNNSSSLNIFNEFLSSSYDLKVCQGYVLMDQLESDDLVAVMNIFLVSKDIADINPGLFCFLEEISHFPQEKEVLFSSATSFRLKNVEKHISGKYYEITSEFYLNEN